MTWQLCAVAFTLSSVLALAAGCKTTAANEKGHPPTQTEIQRPNLGSPAKTSESVEPAGPSFYEVAATANPIRISKLSAKGSGILRSVKVREGERVKSGQLLAILDTTDVGIRSQAAAVAHAQAQEAVRNAKSDLERAQMLFDAGALPDQMIEKAELALRVANLQVESASVGMRMTKQAQADASLVAPFSGVITKVLAEEGQMITQMPPVIIFILADTETLELTVPIPERKLAQVKVGLPVVISLPAMNTERQAKIERISEVVDPMTRSAEAIVQLPNKDHALPGGLYARVRFTSIRADAEDSIPAPTPVPALDAGVPSRPDNRR